MKKELPDALAARCPCGKALETEGSPSPPLSIPHRAKVTERGESQKTQSGSQETEVLLQVLSLSPWAVPPLLRASAFFSVKQTG